MRKNGPVKTFADLSGRTVAIPSRFSDERLILFRAMKVWHMKPDDIKMVEMAPPDVSGALAAGAIDAFSMGEPFPSQAEMARLRPNSFPGARVLARLHVLHSRRAAGLDRHASGRRAGSGGRYCPVGSVA